MRESGEDYLETIYLLSKKNSEVHAVDIANELGFSKPSISKAMGILRTNGYIGIDECNHIRLTELGAAKAKEIYGRHQTITEFWIMHGISPENAAKDACRMEHDISDETYNCIKKIISNNQ